MEIIHSLERIAEILKGADDIVISAHVGPDGDAIGSVCALCALLTKMGKRAYALLEELPERFLQIPGAELVKPRLEEGADFKTFIALDCADKNRLGGFAEYFDKAQITINIDHHISNDNYAMFNYVNSGASAACEIIFDIINAGGFDFDKNIASALYAGILCDTGGFRHPSSTSHTYFAAGELIKQGAAYTELYKGLLAAKSFEELLMAAEAFKRMKREFSGRYIWSYIDKEDMKKAGAKYSDLDSIIDQLKSVKGTQVAVFFYEKPGGEFKASFRSNPGIDVNLVAAKFGGGGHKNAAGCSFFIPLTEAVNAVAKEIETLLD